MMESVMVGFRYMLHINLLPFLVTTVRSRYLSLFKLLFIVKFHFVCIVLLCSQYLCRECCIWSTYLWQSVICIQISILIIH
jgi:hypothetical protein